MANTYPETAAETHQEETNNRHQAAAGSRKQNTSAHLPGERRVEAGRVVPRGRLPLPSPTEKKTDRRECGDYI